ncbi:MAG: PD-(D/E)XK nuclease family protein [Actinobacteria bacterium]|nr:PD-(D/E)XK nuclease family protein [Actinomycetota bacterium]
MTLPLPTSLSPSKVSTFTDCALAFRFSAIDKLPEAPSVPAMKGSLVHRALELLFVRPPAERTPLEARSCLAIAVDEFATDPQFLALGLDGAAQQAFIDDAAKMVERYFLLEDPTAFDPIGIELLLSTSVDDLLLRGIIDRLDLTPDGELIVTDYKTGRPPAERQEASKLGGVHFYSLLCERLFGKRPVKVQLLYLGTNPQIITAVPSEQSTRALERKVTAIWSAVKRACDSEDFRPKPSALCSWCSFQSFCPAFGGDLPTAVELRTPLAAPAADTPVVDAPVADTPVADTPVADTPAADTPVADTPVADAPVADAPVGGELPVSGELPSTGVPPTAMME